MILIIHTWSAKMEHLSSSHLYAIQEIAGETRVEKFKEIGRIVSCVIAAIQRGCDFETAANAGNVPKAIVPLIKVLVGVKIKSHEFIIEALKSDDIYLIIEALRARWFYDGSDKTITNYEYFSKNLLPYVSMSTRREIVKKLAVGLADKQVKLAEDFFDGFVATYGVQEATNFLPACRSDFIYEAIVKHKIVLSNKILKIIYRKYPEIALRYLKFTNPYERRDEIGRTMFRVIDINQYESFMPLLVTKHPEVFVNMQEICHTSASLGNRRTMMFLKNAKHLLIERPRDIIDLMPLKLICDNLTENEFETMFGNILENRWDMFNIDEMLNYLGYYPEDKKATLLRDKVKEKYGFDLYEKVEKMTPKFLLLLPKEERHALARRIIEVRHKVEVSDSDSSWWCYLPVEEAIPAMKMQIVKHWKPLKRKRLFSQLIYLCKLNENMEALLDVLRFVNEKYRNERADVICGMLDRITQEFDLDTFEQEYWSIMFNLIKHLKLKKETAREYWVLIKILKKNVHYCDSHGLPVDDIIELIVKLFLEGRVGVSWMLLEDEAQYERRYLDVCFKNSYWMTMDYKKNVVEGIYSFNERHLKKNNSMQGFSIKDYPHLLKIVEETLKKEQNEKISWIIYTKEKLKKHEPELYKTWFPGEEDDSSIDNFCDELPLEEDKPVPETRKKIIYLTEAIIALKRNYGEIKDNWEQYYECCKNEVTSKKRRRVKLFLKALRWYQDVPIKFAKRSIEERNFNIMGHMFDGVTFSKIAQMYLPKETDEDRNTGYLNALHITAAIRNTTTPIPINLVENYLQAHYMYSFKNYINDGLKLWSYVSYRTSSNQMIVLSRNLSTERLFMKRHAIRLMNAMAARNDLVDFFAEFWRKEQHPIIREILAEKIRKLFAKRPSDETWKLMSSCIEDVSFVIFSEDDILYNLMRSKVIPVEYASAYAEQIMRKLRDFVEKGMSNHDAAKFLDQLFDNLKPECKDHLSDEFYNKVLNIYLQNSHLEFSNANRFIVKVYLNPTSIHFENRLRYLAQLLSVESKRFYGLNMEQRKLTPNVVESVIQIVVYQVQKFKGSLKLVESLSNVFWTIFTPYQHSWSHIMLYLCTEYMKVEPSFEEFGIQVGQNIGYLVEKYTPEYFMQIVELINEFVCNFSFYEYSTTIRNRLTFLEGLIVSKNVHGYIIAAKLINEKIVSEFDHQHCKILQQLSEIDNPVVQSLL
ncbi:uncharacterized protein LOC100679744 isoform X1 [Nasonia vitripennis]|uniref:Uncharacterized protein n=2 Tax=Nasonia vitripennis TaxID=7425 RepID=A0A7M7H2C1_NASVI|nr:uncharacterized protein LOC100679744 isoform X1 [Nasonia vitripennis]